MINISSSHSAIAVLEGLALCPHVNIQLPRLLSRAVPPLVSGTSALTYPSLFFLRLSLISQITFPYASFSKPLHPISSRSLFPITPLEASVSLLPFGLSLLIYLSQIQFSIQLSLKPHLSRSSMTLIQQIQDLPLALQWLRIHLSKD